MLTVFNFLIKCIKQMVFGYYAHLYTAMGSRSKQNKNPHIYSGNCQNSAGTFALQYRQ